jgi:hypothetical protein
MMDPQLGEKLAGTTMRAGFVTRARLSPGHKGLNNKGGL